MHLEFLVDSRELSLGQMLFSFAQGIASTAEGVLPIRTWLYVSFKQIIAALVKV